jgi:hypothetical protein
MRQALDQLDNRGRVVNGYDYHLNVWVENGIVLDCSHPLEMKQQHCCNAHALRGLKLIDLQGHEVRYEA